MAKFLKRLSARLCREALRESAKEGKSWIVTKKLILETEDADIEFDKGETVEIGATPDGDMALDGSAAVVVISDADLASKIADIVVSSDELSDVKFVEKPALDAVMDGEEVDDVIDSLADAPEGEDDDDNIEVAELDVEEKESVESKFAKFSENRINPTKFVVCESILIDEADNSPINMRLLKTDSVKKESFSDYKKFAERVSELKGSLQPGKREIALSEAGEVMGAFDTEANSGEIYPEKTFESADEMDSFDAAPAPMMQDDDMGAETEVLESALCAYEESAKSGKDYMALVEALSTEKTGLKEEAIAKIVSTFDNRSLKECVRVYDSKYGKYVAAFNESVDANNFIAETAEESRFTKRFFG